MLAFHITCLQDHTELKLRRHVRLFFLQMNFSQTYGFRDSYKMNLSQVGADRPAQQMKPTNYTSSTLQPQREDLTFDGNILGHHFEDERGLFRIKCAICAKKYSCKTTLVSHWRQKHGLQGGVSCGVCGKKFGLKSDFLRHKSICTDHKTSTQQPLPDAPAAPVPPTFFEIPEDASPTVPSSQ